MIHLSLLDGVSERERLLLKLLMQGMSVTEISQYGDHSAKTIPHRKKQFFEKPGTQSDTTFWRDVFFQCSLGIASATGSNSHRYINDNHYHHIATSEVISLALENHEFRPWIQPIFCMQTDILTGCGVLVRQEHPQTGVTPPGQFTPLARSSGPIIIVTRQLMKQTADISVSVRHSLLDNFCIGINAPAGYSLAARFERECLNPANKLGSDKTELVLELAERNSTPVAPGTRAMLDSLRQRNITFALDNFGVGHTIYRYLQALPVDFIKIDRSFVQMVSVDEISDHIVNNIIELARKLGLNIVAEGVETQEQADLMTGKGVHFLRGYLCLPSTLGNKFISERVTRVDD